MKFQRISVLLLICLVIGSDGAMARIQTPLEKQLEGRSRDSTLQRRREMLADVVNELRESADESDRKLEELKLQIKKLKLELKEVGKEMRKVRHIRRARHF